MNVRPYHNAAATWLIRRFLILSCALMALVPASAWGQVTMGLNNTGLSSLRYNGLELLGHGDFRVGSILMRDASGSTFYGNSNATVQMDSAQQALTFTYSWGSIRCNYSVVGNRLNLNIVTNNMSPYTIQGVFVEPLAIQFPSAVQEYDGNTPLLLMGGSSNAETMSFSSGVMVLVNDAPQKPLMLGFPWALDRPASSTLFPLRINTDRENMYPAFFPYTDRPIAPGASDQYQVSLRFGPPGSTVQSLAPDSFQSLSAAFPQLLNWTDHRAIGGIFLATSDTRWPTNPRGYLLDSNVNVFTPLGLADFRNRVLGVADSSVRILKDMNAQGMIIWDIEGQQYPHATSYNCDPRMLGQLAPEMDGVADAFFKKFTDAGLRVGVCLRPQQLVIAPDGLSGTQNEVADPGQLLIDKIGYAKQRWGATMFYIDSNGGPNNPLDPAIMRRVFAAYPDVLLIPEHKSLEYYAYTAPHLQFRLGYPSTPSNVSLVYPNGFSVVNTLDGPIDQNFNDLVAAVRHGDILLFKGWFDDQPANSKVKSIYQLAGTNSVPTVAITSPTNGAGVSGTVQILATASDTNGILGVQIKLDGVNLGSELTSSPYTKSLDTTTLSPGGHSLLAVARNSLGITTTSSAVGIVVAAATTPPTVMLSSPANGASVSGNVSVTANASGSAGIAGVQFKLDGASLGSEVTAVPYQVSWNSAGTSNGSHTLSAVVRDTNNATASSAGVVVSVNNVASDNTPPVVSVTLPGGGATVSGNITVSATATDNVGVAGVQFKLDGANLGNEITAGPYSMAFNTASIADGPHTFSAAARDAAGNSANSVPVSVTVRNSTASNPAVLSCTTPGNGNFTGCYYKDSSWTNLALVRTDAIINFDWAYGSPDPALSNTYFSARWLGNFAFTGGDYQFTLSTDDGSLLYIDGQPVINNWGEHGAGPVNVTKTLSPGTHLIRVDYYQLTGRSAASLSWTQTR